MGFWAVGRFSCTHGAKLLLNLVRHRRPGVVVIVQDNDAAGQRGAEWLAAALLPYVPCLKVIAPPASCKDLRAWAAYQVHITFPVRLSPPTSSPCDSHLRRTSGRLTWLYRATAPHFATRWHVLGNIPIPTFTFLLLDSRIRPAQDTRQGRSWGPWGLCLT